MWWNKEDISKEHRADNRRELADIRDTVHAIDGEVKNKQNKIPITIWLTLVLYVLGTLSGAVWWAANQDATTNHTVIMLQQISDNLKDATQSRFTTKEALTQFGIRDTAIRRLTTNIETQNSIQSDMNSRIDSMEDTIAVLYRMQQGK